MKNAISALAIALLAAGSAHAADGGYPSEAPAFVPPPTFSWTGLHAGLNLGGSWLDHGGNWWWGWTGNGGGVSGGGQIGYDYQFSPMFVVGLETDFQGTSISARSPFGVAASLPWFGTVRGRAGFTLLDSHLLIYGTVGFAYGEVRHSWPVWGATVDLRPGWTAGAGAEWAFLPNWSAKAEYLYTDLSADGNNRWGSWAWGADQNPKFHTVRVGVNHHFNLFTPTPVVPSR